MERELLDMQSLLGHLVVMVDLKVTQLLLQNIQTRQHYALRPQRTTGLSTNKYTKIIIIITTIIITIIKIIIMIMIIT